MSSMPGTAKRRVFLVDDHPLVREWLTNLINQQADLEVCGEADSALQGMEGIIALRADLAIIDISLRDSSGIELIKRLKELYPAVAVLVLSMHEESVYAERVLRAGARGYIMKRETTGRVIDAIHAILEGKLYLSRQVTELVTRRIIAGEPASPASAAEQLSDRELQVFEMLGQGIGTRQIGEKLGVSIKTVQVYCARIKEKLNLGSATELLREAIRWNENRTPE